MMDWGKFWARYWPGVGSVVTASGVVGAISFFLSRWVPSLLDRLSGASIRITSPGPMQGLTEKKEDNWGRSYAVAGKLKKLPTNHTIWLLVRDEGSARVWPQCSNRVIPNAD